MNLLFYFLTEEFIQALGWTILHSVWQGAVISLLLGFLLVVLQRSSKLRYLVCVSALILILITSMATFLLYYQTFLQHRSDLQHSAEEQLYNVAAGNPSPISQHNLSDSSGDFMYKYKIYFIPHFPLITTIWFFGILILTLRFLGSLAYTRRLKKYKVADITSTLNENLKTISDKMGLKTQVRLLESSLVGVPMVVGYFKPVILFPIGVIAGLSIKQVEAVLTHELAHIYRKDYLINIFQTLLEILFFYHPGIWWISSRISEEREHCCDEIAVTLNQNTLVYAKALTAIGEMQVGATPSLGMAITGKNGILFKRIKRLLTRTGQTASFSEGFVTACIMIVCIFSISFIAKASFTSSTDIDNSTLVDSFNEATFDANVLNYEDSTGKNNNLIIIQDKKGKIVELYVNGKKIPKGEIKKYNTWIDQSLAQQESKSGKKVPYSKKDKAIAQEIIEEVEETSTDEENFELQKREERRETTRVNRLDSTRVLNDFTRKTMQMAQLGIEMGRLNIEMERLQEKLKIDSDIKVKAQTQNMQKKMKDLEVQMERLGKEIEKSGEEIGSLSLDIASSVLKDLELNINLDSEDVHFDEHEEDQDH